MRELEDAPLIRQAGEKWTEATQAKFLTAIGEGTLPLEAFARWLAQDRHFVIGLISFQSILIAKSQRPGQKLLISGLAALDYELDWFGSIAERQEVDLNAPPHPTCRRYVDYLISAAYTKPFEVLPAILFGVEAAYLAAWSPLKPRGLYADFIEHWSSPRFADYVKGLRTFAEMHPHPQQQKEFEAVLRHERDFWRMTWEG